MKVEVNSNLLEIITSVLWITDLRLLGIEQREEFNADNEVGCVLRESVESGRQAVAVLSDWVKRAEKELTK